MARVLVISYYFPPSGGPGVQRVLKFVRYLPEFGHEPVVLTVPEDAEYPIRDETLLEEVPSDVRVVRSSILEPYQLYRRFVGGGEKTGSLDLEALHRPNEGMRARLARWARGTLFIPDGRVGWMPGGIRAGRDLCDNDGIDAIVASGPPFTSHWIGARLAASTGIPLILDFRDPWTRATFYPSRPHFARRLDEMLERHCLETADRVLSVNQSIVDDLVERYPTLDRAKFAIIPNGFDPDDFAGIAPVREPRTILAHVGSVFTPRIPWTLLEVIEELAEEPEFRETFRLRFVGRIVSELEARLAQSPLSSVVENLGYVSHRESVEQMVHADSLLLLTSEDATSGGMLTGKVFEYLGSGSPILALAPPGEARELLEKTGAGVAYLPDDREGLRSALRALVDSKRTGATLSEPVSGARDAYTRRALTGQLSRFLDELTAGRL